MEISSKNNNVDINIKNNNTEQSEEERYESKLGNKDYWDNFYSEEIDQFNNNTALIGEVWFGKQVQKKIIEYINKTISDKNINILDIGSGNGAFLFKLLKFNFTNLHGMDYSENSVQLAQKIILHKLQEGETQYNHVQFYQEDLKNPQKHSANEADKYELIHDKGTFDAYMLNKSNSNVQYCNYIYYNLKNNGKFIITSCNHLKADLIRLFIDDNNLSKDKFQFSLTGEIPHKSFSFGGQTGQTVTTVIFTIKKF